MNWKKIFALFSVALLIGSAFMPWISVPDKDIVVSGVDASGTNYGKPAFFNLLMVLCFLVFTFINQVWAARFNVFFAAMNMAWAIRNLIVLGHCVAGECPTKETGIYLHVISSLFILVAAMLPGNVPRSWSARSGVE